MLVHGYAAPVVFDGDRGAVGVEADADVRRIAIHRLVDGVVENLPDQVMQTSRSNAPDIHAGALAHGLQTLENRNVFRGVIGGGHAYNAVSLPAFGPGLRVCCADHSAMRSLARVLTIVTAFHAQSAAAAPVEAVPVPGGRAAWARVLGLATTPDPARFVSEIARLVYGND